MKVILFVLSLGIVISAETVDRYEISYYNAGATTPFQVVNLPAGSYTCNETLTDSTIITNPSTLEWNDPNASGRVCRYVESAGGPLLTFPPGNYEGTLRAINEFGTSPESNRAPFARGTMASVPTNLRIVR